MNYALGFHIVGDDTVYYSKDGRRFATGDECFDAKLAEDKFGLKTVRHCVVDVDRGVAVGQVWKRVRVA